MTRKSRSLIRIAAVGAAAAALMLSGCSGQAAKQDEGSADKPVSIRFSWWGDEARATLTEDVVADFEKAHPNIKVKTEPGAFDGYFDRLATATAAGDAPDVITLGGAYPLEYAARGALTDLSKVKDSLDTSKFEKNILANAVYKDKLYGVPTGVNTVAMLANPAIFKAAGVPMPDDDTWTWEDFAKIANQIGQKAGNGIVGFEPRFYDFDRVYLAQRGSPMYTEEGKLDVDEKVLADYWKMELDLSKNGGMPTAEQLNEVIQAAPEQTLLAQGKAAMASAYSNQVKAYSDALGQPLVLLKFPGETEFKRPGMTLLPSQYYTIASNSKHQKAAAELIDYLVNSTKAGAKLLTNRGMPANSTVRDSIADKLDPFQQQESDFIDRIAKDGGKGLPPQPAGASIHNDLTIRIDSDVLFGRKTPQDAAKEWVSEMKSALGS